MNPTRRAVIDVGTNSVKLLVADVLERRVDPLWEESEQTRLGRGFYAERCLQPDAIQATVRAIHLFVETARSYGVPGPRIIATSAARDALNQDDLRRAVEESTGLALEIISGAEEADLVFRGVFSDPAYAGRSLLIMDVGGGSTEFILGSANAMTFRESFPLGSVRCLEQLQPSDPPAPGELAACRETIRQFIATEVKPRLAQALKQYPGVDLVGTGGSATILARMEGRLDDFDRQGVETARITYQAAQRWVSHLWSQPLQDRKRIVGLPKKRADVILTGAVIYEAVMEAFAFETLRVSTRGLRFAAVIQDRALSKGGGADSLPEVREAVLP